MKSFMSGRNNTYKGSVVQEVKKRLEMSGDLNMQRLQTTMRSFKGVEEGVVVRLIF